MNNLSIKKNIAMEMVVHKNTSDPEISTASFRVSINPVARSAPAANETSMKENL